MKSVGIIAEFNPFHNGHQYLLKEAKKAANADAVIVVMSGHFMQRGEGSIYSKWRRAETAVRGGADLVIELPTVFALQSADFFARGGIGILQALSVDAVAFGVEHATLQELLFAAQKTHNSPSAFTQRQKEALSVGMSYSAAFSEALKSVLPDFSMLPNHILALSYMHAAADLGFSPEWIPVPRIGALHDQVGDGTFSSASHLRRLLVSSPHDARPFLPYAPALPESDPELLDTLALSNLRRTSAEEISFISGVSEGLENRLKEAALAPSFTAFLEKAATRRYSQSRIRRAAYSALLGIRSGLPTRAPEYLRVLAMNQKGRSFIHETKGSLPLPFIIKTADAAPSEMLSIDCLATDLWALSTKDGTGRQDYLTSPILVN